jgi:hypothetical protein
MKTYHDEPCGGHFVDKRTGYKALHMGYYWPILFQDAKSMYKDVTVANEWANPFD